MKTTPRKSVRAPLKKNANPPAASDDESMGTTPNSRIPERIPPQWIWHYTTLSRLRERLMRAYAEHTSAFSAPVEKRAVDDVDASEEQAERDLLWSELVNEENSVFEVDCALQRIRDGVYGYCEETGEIIPPDRLRAVPWTRYSHGVAQAREKLKQQPGR